MIINEKLAELNRLMNSMNLSGGTNEEKLFIAVTDALNEMASVLAGYEETFDGIAEALSDVEESVYELEGEVFGDNDGDTAYGGYDFEDDVYDITCENCNKTITVDYDVLDSGSVNCPSCGEVIEFTIEDE